ncbi:MAG: MFS transporter [Arachnia propionica]|uniref:MFS transporter n=1 Tax=Arachnia propionica TaxID=1750 RepID=UPI00270EF02E|nr:MFS transporter [Arachnia propionica]
MSQRTTTSRAVHHHRDFRRLWASNLCQELGRQFATLAIAVTAVVLLEATAWQVGLITALGNIAYLLIGLPVGVWVDRWRKRRVLLWSDVVRAAAMLSIPVAHALGHLTIIQLMVVAAVLSFSSVLADTAQTAFVPQLVGPDKVSEATARLQSTDSTMRVIGPGLVSVVLLRIAAPWLHVVGALTSLLSAWSISSIKDEGVAAAGQRAEPFGAALRAGLGFTLQHAVLRVFLVTNGLVNLGAGVFATLVTVVALRDFGIPPEQYALAGALGAGGGIVGSLIGLRCRNRLGEIRTILVCYCLLPVAGLILPLGHVIPVPAVALVAVSDFCFSCLVVVSAISGTGVRARTTPLELMGRVASVSRFVTIGAVPVGALIGGLLGGILPHGVALLSAVLATSTAALCFWCSSIGRHRDLPEQWQVDQAPGLV